MDQGNSPSRDVAVQTTPIETGVDSFAQTDETPLGVVLRDVRIDTLLPRLARLLDARLASLTLGDGEEGEEDEDGSRVHAALHWLADSGPDSSDDDNNDDYDDDVEGDAPGLTNGHSGQ
ncbi:uncharacterized protein N7443_003699 [Penicillium atrosanguineum]|uniref:Uncharacterized protein n=1 Tax=Penicillium atrosanguineum TaxID=1132637 RepID=A0A9W9Q2S7_9EURO|nr:uncharacterized protein N7443_003699 [Penicillium atrosanguineum]KAJ5134680.1 hypothetical protein N7526_006045 [Penicillium atrosanguineum]KAJ5304039.1 hypothetical protein N7443_003699 [Penicillium atrosanguineum]KAJ5323516.1 hypothetical protein N7476_002116 [Penicillium atrosanguineum]